ncbi:23S rRNA (uracil(1939)-C(5))-methyltransferase RlmD [Spirochaeta dissipatitropha]
MSKRKRGRKRRPSEIPQPTAAQTAEPYCIHFDHCGGCTLQHFTYEAQLELKQQIVDKAFSREGLIDQLPAALPVFPAARTRGYRNKLEYTFSRRRWLTPDEIASEEEFEHRDGAGFHVRGHFDRVLDLESCWHQPEPSNEIRCFVRDKARELGISFYDIAENEGEIRTLMLRNTREGKWMVVVMFGKELSQPTKQLLEMLRDRFPQIASLYYIINTGKNSSPIGHDCHLFSGTEVLYENCGKLRFAIHPASFFQTNTEQAEELYRITSEWANLAGTETVYDLYSGIGSIGLSLADSAGKVIGIEIIEDAVDGARENADLNNITNSVFFAGEAEKICTRDFFAEHGQPDLIILDPPRPGLHKTLITSLREIAAPRIIYISCNPATQADDLELLTDMYRVVKRQAVDLFPQTMHVENICELELKQ